VGVTCLGDTSNSEACLSENEQGGLESEQYAVIGVCGITQKGCVSHVAKDLEPLPPQLVEEYHSAANTAMVDKMRGEGLRLVANLTALGFTGHNARLGAFLYAAGYSRHEQGGEAAKAAQLNDRVEPEGPPEGNGGGSRASQGGGHTDQGYKRSRWPGGTQQPHGQHK
jgi:hypothetical protein